MNPLRACLSVSGIFLLAALFGAAPPVHAQGDASRATPPPGKALVFVFRSDRQPVAAQVPVLVNLVRIGDLTDGTFAVATVNPGRTFLRIGEQALAVFTLEAVANRSYFVRVEAVSSVRPVRTEVRLVSETDGRRSLAQSRLLGAAPAIAAAPRAQPPAAPVAAPAAAPRAQPSPPQPAPSAAGGDWTFALIATGGAFKLASANQTVAGLPSTFDAASKPAAGIEGELRHRGGFALGGEVFYYKNDLLLNGTALKAQQQVIAVMANGKYYFRVADWFHPFVGVGVGATDAVYSGDLTGSAGGAAFQGMAGMEFRFEHVGVLVQYKYLASTTGKSGSDVKVGGGGVLAGLSIIF
jgi:opacity protein-like surface antigen